MSGSRWRRRGEDDRLQGRNTAYAKFVAECERLESEVVSAAEKSLQRVATSDRDWRAAAWLLTRKRPEFYSDKAADAQLVDRLRMQCMEELAVTLERIAPPEFLTQLWRYLAEVADHRLELSEAELKQIERGTGELPG